MEGWLEISLFFNCPVYFSGKNAAPNRQPVNAAAAAAAAKPKVQVAKKANILSTLAPTA